MKFTLERHLYAPELNRAHIGCTAFPVPGCRTVAEARKKLFPPLARKGRHTTIRVTYSKTLAHLNRDYHGFIHDTRHLKWCLERVRAWHNADTPTITVHTRLLG